MIEDDNENIPKLTDLDIQRLEEMVDGESVHGEDGNWSVHHYGEKGGLVVFTLSSFPCLEFRDLNEVIKFLHGEKTTSFKQIIV